MATTRDLVEAQAFGRRRVATALVSGRLPGEPRRPLRAVVGGLVLAGLLVAGVTVGGMLTGRAPAGWDRPGLVVDEDTGALYVIVDERDEPVLHPVANLTSARLILGDDVTPTVLAGDLVAAQRLGADLGIAGAPPDVPTPDRLVGSGWSACATDGGVATALTDPGVRPVDRGSTVRSEGRTYVLATGRDGLAHRYPLPTDVEPDPLLDALGLPIAAAAPEVPAAWLALFPEGGSLEFATLGLQAYGDPAPDRGPGRWPPDARVGQVVTLPDGEVQVLTAAGPATLDPFARAVLETAARPVLADPLDPVPLRLPALPPVRRAVPPFAGAQWPDRLPGAGAGAETGAPCALLVARPDEQPVTVLATGRAGPAGVSIDPGRGAHVRVGSASYLVDSRGAAHRLVGPDTADRLGLGDAPEIPGAWVDLLPRGVPLSREAALDPTGS